MKKPKIGLVGFFGFGNFGDELFVEAHREHLNEEFELLVVNDLIEAPYLSSKRVGELESFDAFLIGGGDLINPKTVSPLYWRDDYLKKPIFVYSLGVPYPNSKTTKSINYLQGYLGSDNTKIVIARDVESLNYFERNLRCEGKAFNYPDAVCALSLPKVQKLQDKTLGVVIRSHRSVVGEYECVRAAVNNAKQLGYKIRIIVAATGKLGKDDLEASMKFCQEDEEIFSSEDLYELCAAIGECHMLMSMKYHGMIVAAKYGIPSLQMSATQKNRNFLRYLQRPDLQSNYNDKSLAERIPYQPAPIHSLLRRKLIRDSRMGYEKLKECMQNILC